MSLRTRLVLICLLICGNENTHGSQLISGNATTDTETTSFNIGVHDFNIKSANMFIGAGTAIANNSYAVARANSETNSLEPLAPSTININGATEKNSKGETVFKLESNPLNGAKINFLKLNHSNPSVIKDGDNTLYAYTNIIDAPRILSSDEEIKDANGDTASSILSLEVANGTSHTFIACTPTTFGQTNSGISLFKNTTDKNNVTTLAIQNNKKACALNNSSSSIKIGSDVSLANAVDMFWDGDLQCLFIGLQSTSGSTAGDGARSVVVGKVQQVSDKDYDEIVFEKFAPDSLFSGNNQIVGTASASSTVSAIKLKTMITSTRLHYLIVNGGNGTANTVGNQVYALPIVNGSNSNKGHLAKFNQDPTNTFSTNNILSKRTLDTAATTAADTLTNSSDAAKVGDGVLPLNADEKITDLFVAGDSVYASIGTTTASDATGIFHSQAIFDNNGLITNWTAWQRVGGSKDTIYGANIDQTKGIYWSLKGTSSNVNTIKKTTWGSASKNGLFGGTTSDETVGLIANLSTLFPAEDGGIFNIKNFPKENAALNNTSLLIATGSEKVVIINPNATTTGDYSSGLTSSTNDTMPTTTTSSTIASISGTNLSSLGPIVTSHIATNSSGESWIIVGGANGVAILRQTSGAGWSTAITDLSGISTSFKFEIFGSYSYVKKVSSDSNYLYILDENQLDRIPLNSTAINAGTKTTITQTGTLSGTTTSDVFNDFIVSEKLGILATSAGTYRVSNGGDIANTTVGWTKLSIPEDRAIQSSKIIFVSPTNLESGFASSGNLYILNSYRGLHQAQVNRFYVNLSADIDNDTIKPLPDFFVKNINSYFINFESFRDNFFTDGTLLINSLSKDGSQNSYVHIIGPKIASGRYDHSYYNISLDSIDSSNFVSNITRSSNTGSIIVSGEFGILVNE